jgi:hypothetical protein
MAGSGDEAVKRHTPVHDDLAVSGVCIVHSVPPKVLRDTDPITSGDTQPDVRS